MHVVTAAIVLNQRAMALQTQITSPSFAKVIPSQKHSHRSSAVTSMHIRPDLEKSLKGNSK